MVARERDVNSWLIEEIQVLQDIDILYRITMSTNPALVDAAMEQIERFLSIENKEEKQEESSTTLERNESKTSAVIETSATEEEQQSYTLEEIQALNDMDILYQIAMSGTPTEMEAANVAIQTLMSSPPAVEKEKTLSRLEDTRESEEQSKDQKIDSASLTEKSEDEEAITLENAKEETEQTEFEERQQKTRVEETPTSGTDYNPKNKTPSAMAQSSAGFCRGITYQFRGVRSNQRF